METRSHVNPGCSDPHSVPYSEHRLSVAADVYRAARLALQNRGLLRSVLGQETVTDVNAVELGRSFGVRASFILEPKRGSVLSWINAVLEL